MMASGEPDCQRWTAQRWLVDNIILSNGVEFDQGRLSVIQALAGAQIAPEVATLKARKQKFDDIAPDRVAAMIAGMAHAWAESNGTNALPGSPNCCISRSITKAARAR